MVWCYIVPELSTPVILEMDQLTQLNPKINWFEKIIEWTSNNINVFLEACGSSRMCDHIGQLNLIGGQQLNNLVHMTKGKNICSQIVQCSMHTKLDAAKVKKNKKTKWYAFMLCHWHLALFSLLAVGKCSRLDIRFVF